MGLTRDGGRGLGGLVGGGGSTGVAGASGAHLHVRTGLPARAFDGGNLRFYRVKITFRLEIIFPDLILILTFPASLFSLLDLLHQGHLQPSKLSGKAGQVVSP